MFNTAHLLLSTPLKDGPNISITVDTDSSFTSFPVNFTFKLFNSSNSVIYESSKTLEEGKIWNIYLYGKQTRGAKSFSISGDSSKVSKYRYNEGHFHIGEVLQNNSTFHCTLNLDYEGTSGGTIYAMGK